MTSCRTAFLGGWNSVKLYFMLGLPTETDEDVLGIADLAKKVLQLWRETAPDKRRGCRITVSTACFVPKPHTAFQWEPQVTREEYLRRVKLLRENMRDKSIAYHWHDPDTSFLEAVFSRGDRRLADVLEAAWREGAKFDAWSEYFDLERWMRAFEACGLDPAFYANRARRPGGGPPLEPGLHRSADRLFVAGAGAGLRRRHYPGLPEAVHRLRGKLPAGEGEGL